MRLIALLIIIVFQGVVIASCVRYPIEERYALVKVVACIFIAFWVGLAFGWLL